MHATLARARHAQPEAPIWVFAAEEVAFPHLDYDLSWDLVRLQQPGNYVLDGTGGAVLALARGSAEVPQPPRVGWLLKLRNLDRPAYESVVAYHAYAADSPLATVLALPVPPLLWPTRLMRYVAGFEARFGGTDDVFLLGLFCVMRSVNRGLLLLVDVWLVSVAVAVAAAWLLTRRMRRRAMKEA